MDKKLDTNEAVKKMVEVVDESLGVVREVFHTRDYLKIKAFQKESCGFAKKKSGKVYEEIKSDPS